MDGSGMVCSDSVGLVIGWPGSGPFGPDTSFCRPVKVGLVSKTDHNQIILAHDLIGLKVLGFISGVFIKCRPTMHIGWMSVKLG